MISGNKGEWSEVYALFKILSDGELCPGDANLNPIPNLILPVIKVLRDEGHSTIEFELLNGNVEVKSSSGQLVISRGDFRTYAKHLLNEINAATGTFSNDRIEQFLNSFNSKSLKASSTAKSDIRVVVHDLRTGVKPELGFSIKSELGNPSTLLNAGRTTNFVYQISKSISQNEINRINAIDSKNKIQERIKAVQNLGARLNFVGTEKKIFSNNLTLIDSRLPELISHLLHDFYSGFASSLDDLVANIARINPLKYDLTTGQEFYSYKVKKFLTEIALGMMPGSVWTGIADATGGLLIVKETGDIVSYHIYNRNQFEDYLLASTKFETASSSRHGFGSIYETINGQFFNLNLQIRFKK